MLTVSRASCLTSGQPIDYRAWHNRWINTGLHMVGATTTTPITGSGSVGRLFHSELLEAKCYLKYWVCKAGSRPSHSDLNNPQRTQGPRIIVRESLLIDVLAPKHKADTRTHNGVRHIHTPYPVSCPWDAYFLGELRMSFKLKIYNTANKEGATEVYI